MAATLAQQYGLGVDQAFIRRVRAAILNFCLTVETELTSVTNHTARLALANKVVQAPDTYAPVFAALLPAGTQTTQVTIGTAYVSTTPPSSDNVADADILTLVSLGWNIVAGV